MQNANDQKIGERTFAVSLLSVGLGSGISVLVTDTLGKIISIMIAIVFILVVLLGLYKRISNFFIKIGGSRLIDFLGIFMPVVGVLTMVLYPIAIGVITSLGIDLDKNIIVIAILSALIAIANIVILILNISTLLRRPKVLQG
jgi:hypothetical protein